MDSLTEGQVFAFTLELCRKWKADSSPKPNCLGPSGIVGFDELKMYGLNSLRVSKEIPRWWVHKELTLSVWMSLDVSK